MFAEELEVDAERLLARAAVLAGEIADAAVDDDGVTDFELVVGDSAQVADGIDGARRVRAEHPWRLGDRDTRQATNDEQIQMVKRCCADAHPDLAALGFGLLEIGAVLDLIESAVRGNGESSHGFMRALYSVGTSSYARRNCKIPTLISICFGSI